MASFGSELFRRRVPQFLGVYLAAGWATLEFTDFLVNRFVLSPNLTDLALLAWAVMIPTVLLLAWVHGAPGPDEWTTTEKIGIPLNVAVAALLMFVLFQGKDLGAATTSVTVETEEGETVERVIPKSEFRKHVALFFFDNESADPDLDWLQYAIPWGLQDDLLQDIFLDVQAGNPVTVTETGVIESLRNAGYSDGLRAPLSLKRGIAEELHRDHFVTGTIGSSSSQLTVTTQLYETARGKLIEERTFTGDSPFDLIDQISTQLRLDLEVPSQHVEETRDLPVSEMHTESPTAYRARNEALLDMMIENDWPGAAAKLEAAVAEDPTYAIAHMDRFVTYLFLNDSETATQALQSGLDHSYKLPERVQFAAKAAYYRLVKQDMEKAQAVVGMWSELYPDDLAAHSMRAQMHAQQNETERAIEAYERIFELDPGQYDALRTIGDLYLQVGDFDAAESYYQRYADHFPDDPRSFMPLGQLSKLKGDHEAAKQYYERAQLLEPANVAAVIRLGWAEYDLGDFDTALEYLEEGLATSTTSEQRMQALDALRSYYRQRGQARRAVEYMHSQWEEARASLPPASALLTMFNSLNTYVSAGMTKAALDTLDSVKSRLSPPLDLLSAVGDLSVAMARNDADQLEAALTGMDELIDGLGFEVLRFAQIRGGGRLLELQGDCEQAIVSYERALSLQPTSTSFYIDIGRCHRMLGNLTTAEASLQQTLNVAPYSGLTHLELAKVHIDMEDRAGAIEHLEVALRVWENADPGFERASEARQLLVDLEP
jgi:tetratricopeptide (TPR) repeat protein